MARRYILDNPNKVRKLVTVGSPFLGATQALDTLETGRVGFFYEIIQSMILLQRNLRPLVKDFKSVHELLPSEAYFDLGGRPFIEKTYDANGNGIGSEIYGYSQLFNFVNSRYSTVPYQINRDFHSNPGQDDWQLDASGVEYYHIFGQQRYPQTPETVIATPVVKEPNSNPTSKFKFRVERGFGDETVPRLSAERIGSNGLDLNADNATVIGYFAQTRSDDKKYKHVGLVKAEDVRQEILENLGLASQPVMGSFEQQDKKNKMRIVTRTPGGKNGAVEPPPQEGHYLHIDGVERLEITDDEGNTNTPVGDAGFEYAVPGVNISGGSPDGGVHDLTAAADIPLTIKFRVGNEALIIEFVRGTNQNVPNYAVRYLDLRLPVGVQALLTITPQGMDDLKYDSDGNGTFDVTVPPFSRVTGTSALDVTAPRVQISKVDNGSQRTITITGTDTQSGVNRIFYSLNGWQSGNLYTGPIVVSAREAQIVQAFADDNVGNRSSPVRQSFKALPRIP